MELLACSSRRGREVYLFVGAGLIAFDFWYSELLVWIVGVEMGLARGVGEDTRKDMFLEGAGPLLFLMSLVLDLSRSKQPFAWTIHVGLPCK